MVQKNSYHKYYCTQNLTKNINLLTKPMTICLFYTGGKQISPICIFKCTTQVCITTNHQRIIYHSCKLSLKTRKVLSRYISWMLSNIESYITHSDSPLSRKWSVLSKSTRSRTVQLILKTWTMPKSYGKRRTLFEREYYP